MKRPRTLAARNQVVLAIVDTKLAALQAKYKDTTIKVKIAPSIAEAAMQRELNRASKDTVLRIGAVDIKQSALQGAIGQIDITEFDDPQTLKQEGNGLYSATSAGKPAENTVAMQGMIEGSNVKPVVEMTRMIEVLRNYQATQQMLDAENNRLRAMVQKLTRSS